jgi:hypothetical protein
MSLQPIGSQWLKQHYNLSHYLLTHSSYIGSNESVELTSKGHVEQIYGPKYKVADETPLEHLEFSLKYDDFNLDFLKAVFEKISGDQIETFVASAPGSRYPRKIGFLYEFLTGEQINLSKSVSGNYVDLLDEAKYITGKPIKNTRWRINNNLLGTIAYCPVVRKTKELKDMLSLNIRENIQELRKGYSPDIFNRAINYLYTKETKSSYEIEKESPSVSRMEKFVALLAKAGTDVSNAPLSPIAKCNSRSTVRGNRFSRFSKLCGRIAT